MLKSFINKRCKHGCLVIFVLCSVVIVVWFICRMVAMNPQITFTNTDNDTLAVFHLSIDNGRCIVSTCPDNSGRVISFLVDTGNNTDCFRIHSDDMEYLERLGLLSRFSRWLAPYPTASALKRFSHGMNPFNTYKTGRLPVYPYNEIEGAYFMKTNDRQSNMIGMSFLRNQLVEFSKQNGVMRIHKTIPWDYTRYLNLKRDTQKFLHYFRRYDIQMEINGRTHWFFLDTGHVMLT